MNSFRLALENFVTFAPDALAPSRAVLRRKAPHSQAIEVQPHQLAHLGPVGAGPQHHFAGALGRRRPGLRRVLQNHECDIVALQRAGREILHRTHQRVVDHRADFSQLVSSGSRLITLPSTFQSPWKMMRVVGSLGRMPVNSGGGWSSGQPAGRVSTVCR